MEQEHSASHSFAIASDQPLIGLLSDEDGRQVVRYFTSDSDVARGDDATLRAALGVIGAWEDLDWDEFSAELDRIRHDHPPTPPIEL